MKARRILSDIEVSLKGWYRNKARLFWTLAFPTLLILIFGSIFSGEGENYTLYICNEDNTPVSEALIENLSHVMEIKMVDGDIEKYALDHPVLLIPQGFGESVMKKKKCNLSLYINPTDAVVRTIIMGFVNKM
ncbi:MAG TPA: hypothetical protein ENI33_05990, partial [Thermoplasmatales archaeon]|nr:hypothetical protein [Thermoplasmatales archaeon]